MTPMTTRSIVFGLAVAASVVGAALITAQEPAAPVQTVRPIPPAQAGAWYTDGQAQRGRALFMKNCGMCHSADPTTTHKPEETTRGFRLGNTLSVMGGLGGRGLQRFPNVYHLFRRIRDSMPGWDIDSVSPVEKVDIVAYLLKSNGYPAGREELRLNIPAMKAMRLVEPVPIDDGPGFRPIFDGTRITGMKYLFGFNCKPAPPGCGRTDDAGVYKIEKGVLVAEGRYHGMMYTEAKYLHFDLRFDYRWVPPADLDLEDEFFNVSNGYLIFVEDPMIWPKGIEIEGDENGIMRASPLTVQAKSTYDITTLARYKKAVGKWNSVRILSENGQVKAFLNGGLITQIHEHPFKNPGHVAFQYQGGRIEWRNIRIKGI